MNRLPAPEVPAWLARHLPFDRYVLPIGEHRIHVMEQGAGTPVFLLHGNPTWSFLWRKVASELRGEKLRLIMPDLVGLGLSNKPRDLAWHSLERHVDVMARVLDALALERVIFVGQDWGGPIGGGALAMRPSLMRGAVILNTVLGPPKPGFKATTFHRFARMPVVSDFAFRWIGFPQVALGIAQGDKLSIRGEVSRAYRFPLRGRDQNAAPLALARMVPDSLAHPSVPMLERCRDYFEAFKGPAEIVWGDRDPVLGRARGRVERTLPHAKVTRTQGGHFLQEEVPVEIAAAIRRVAAAVTR